MIKRRTVGSILAWMALTVAAPAPAASQGAADSAAIRATALDYIEGWYTGDGDRMARALHPELVKRLHLTDPGSGRSWINDMGKSSLVAGTRAGGGSKTPEAERRADVTVLDVFRGAAAVRIDASDWIDYLQMVEEDGRWLIVNVLWELREPQQGSGLR